MKNLFLILSTILFYSNTLNGQHPQTNEASQSGQSVEVLERFIAIDNVCAWPNLIHLKNGSIVAIIFNQPSHGRSEGDVEAWISEEGRFWNKIGNPTVHDPGTNRMNVAAGLSQTGAMVVLASGWELRKNPDDEGKVILFRVLRPWISISSDGGRSWKVNKTGFPIAANGMTNFVPYGEIVEGGDGSLRVICYAQSLKQDINEASMFRSVDDGVTWKLEKQITKSLQHPANLLKLKNGNLLLTYGNRIKGQYGVAVKVSSDKGHTWSDEMILLEQDFNADIGYPSSVEMEDGRIISAYYASRVKNHSRYHMGTIIWRFK